MLLLTVNDGRNVVLRLMGREPWRTHAAGLLGRESAVQRQLRNTPIPAPRTLALDAAGVEVGTPAHLMSWLPGSVQLRRQDDEFLGGVARLLAEIHDHDPGADRPRNYQSWAGPAKRILPAWTRHPWLWEQAFDLLEQDPPDHAGTFLHRDFHVGNVLWESGRISGVVDWVETSWGPAGLDLAHVTTYLSMLHGPETGQRLVQLYRSLGQQRVDAAAQRYWDVMDIVGYLPDPAKVVQPWRELGSGVTVAQAQSRLESHLMAVVQGAAHT